MWNRNAHRIAAAASFVAGLTAVALGCGKSDPANPSANLPAAQFSGSCAAGQFSIGGLCAVGNTFESACAYSGGLIKNTGGHSLCQVQYRFPTTWGGTFEISGYNFFPRLSPDDPAGYMAYSTGITVNPGDKLSFSATGGWGGTSAESYSALGLFNFTTWTLDCSEVSVNGYKDGKAAVYEGLSAGLVGSDGTEVFTLGANVVRTIKNHGTLRFGFNAPLQTGSCANVVITNLKVLHCEDSSHTTYPCS